MFSSVHCLLPAAAQFAFLFKLPFCSKTYWFCSKIYGCWLESTLSAWSSKTPKVWSLYCANPALTLCLPLFLFSATRHLYPVHRTPRAQAASRPLFRLFALPSPSISAGQSLSRPPIPCPPRSPLCSLGVAPLLASHLPLS